MEWEEENAAKQWTVVISKKRKNNTTRHRHKHKQPSTNNDIDIGFPSQHHSVKMEAEQEDRHEILNKMHHAIKKLEESPFYKKFIEQLQTPEILDSIMRVVGSESHLEMVVYGIGSIGNSERSRLQLSLALVLKKNFLWVGDIEVFDPIVSSSEQRVIESMGCKFSDLNDEGRRIANNPILFFMPHCEGFLYENLLQSNWSPLLLSRIVLLGNSFSSYVENSVVDRKPPRHVLAIAEHTHEVGVKTVCSEFFPAFNHMSWHFFALDPLFDLKNLEV